VGFLAVMLGFLDLQVLYDVAVQVLSMVATPNPNERGFQGIKRLAWVILGLQEFQGSCSDDGNGVLMGRWFG